MKLSISQLRVFEAVARTGSFSRAAQELGITQPSVSTQLRAFENQSRARLLARDGHAISPTRLGDTILPRVRALVTIANELELVLTEERSLKRGVLRIGYSTHQFAIPILSKMMAAHPGVKVEARSMASLDLIDMLNRGAIDAAFITAREAPADLECVKILTNDIVLMLPAAHPLAGREEIDWPDVTGFPLIRREGTSGTRRIFDQAAEQAGISLRTVLDLGSWDSLRCAVEAGIGGCIALEGEVEPNERIAIVRIRDKDLWASHYLACAPDMRGVATVDALFDVAVTVW